MKAESIRCRANLRQLQLAWLLYADENNDVLSLNEKAPSNSREQNDLFQGPSPRGSWVVGDASVDTNNANIKLGSLFPTLASPEVYRSPEDKSEVVKTRSQVFPRSRHYSMSCFMNGKSDNSSLDTALVFHKPSDIKSPPPTKSFVFIHESPASITSGLFYFWGNPIMYNGLANAPASFGNAGDLSFADGHVEHWPWRHTPKMGTYSGEGGADFYRLVRATPLGHAVGLSENP